MIVDFEERPSDSPYVETIMRGRTESDGSTIRPAESHWHMVFSKHRGRMLPLVVGPWMTAGVASWGEGAEILWIKFKLGTFMPHLPTKAFVNTETLLPRSAGQSFWLNGSSWQFPDYDNAETFVEWLARAGVLVRDPLVGAALEDRPQDVAPRTVRHRFARATGLPQIHIRQMKQAQRAEALLRQGVPILDTVYEAGYYDQPHLTRSLKRFIGHTPAQIVSSGAPE